MTDLARPQPPLADTVSPEARAILGPMLAAPPPPEMSVADMRAFAAQMTAFFLPPRQTAFPTTVEATKLGGVAVAMVRPARDADDGRGLLLNFHGGGFIVDSGSLLESVPIAALTGVTVASVFYRLAPEHPYPAAVDDALAAYKAAIARHGASRVAIFGTSAGAVLTLQLLVRLRAEGLPLPAAAGVFSGSADLARAGDIEGYLPALVPGKSAPQVLAAYVGAADPRDPLVSPLFADLTGLPPVLVMSSTRDLLLSQCALLHLALRDAAVPCELLVYEGLPHAFWAGVDCPETTAALQAQATFLSRYLAP